MVAKILHGEIITPCRPGGCQFTAWVLFSKQNVSQSGTGLHTQLGQHKNVLHYTDLAQVHGTAGIDDQHKFGIFLIQRQNIPLFSGGKFDVAGDGVPVIALAGDPGEHIDGHIALAIQGKVIFRFRHGLAHGVHNDICLAGLGFGLHSGMEGFLGFHIGGIVGIQPLAGGDGETCFPQSLLHIDEVTGVDLTGTGAALDGFPDTAAIGCDLTGGIQREIAAILQQDGAFCQRLTQGGKMLFFVIE